MKNISKIVLCVLLSMSFFITLWEPAAVINAANLSESLVVERYSSTDKPKAKGKLAIVRDGENDWDDEPGVDVEVEENTEEPTEEEGFIEETPIKVLMIGNSMIKKPSNTYSVYSILTDLARMNRHNIEITGISNGSAYLYYYAYLTEDHKEYHKAATNELMNNQYHYIILQDQTRAGIEAYDTLMEPAVRQLINYISNYQNNAKVLLYQTPGYQDGTKTRLDGVQIELSALEMQQRVAVAYQRLGKEFGVDVVPVGMNLYQAQQVYGDQYKIICDDKRHPDYAGYFIAACAFYYKLFGELPVVKAEELRICSLDSRGEKCDLVDEDFALLAELVNNKMSMSNEFAKIDEGNTLQLGAEIVSNELDEYISWKSLDTSVATVSEEGLVTAVEKGMTAIIAETPSGLQAICVVTVNEGAVPKLEFGKSSYIVGVGDRVRILPKETSYLPWDKYNWSSGQKTVATVSKDGTVVAYKPGRSKITITSSMDATVTAYYYLYVKSFPVKELSWVAGKGTSATECQITVNWKKVKGATNYGVYYSTKKDGTYTLAGSSTGDSYTIKHLLAGTTYYIKIATDAGYNNTKSDYSPVITARVPNQVTDVTLTATKKKKIKMTWKKVSGISGYEIYRSTKKTSGFKMIAELGAGASKYTDGDIKIGKKYYYKIKAYKLNGDTKIYSYESAVRARSVKK